MALETVLMAVLLVFPLQLIAVQLPSPCNIIEEYSSSPLRQLAHLACLELESDNVPSEEYERPPPDSGTPDMLPWNRTPPVSAEVVLTPPDDSNPASPAADQATTAEERAQAAIAAYIEELGDGLRNENRYAVTERLCELILEYFDRSETHDSALESLIQWDDDVVQAAKAFSQSQYSNAAASSSRGKHKSPTLRFSPDDVPLLADFYLHRFHNLPSSNDRDQKVRKSISAIIICFCIHFGANAASFASRYPLVPISRFFDHCSTMGNCNREEKDQLRQGVRKKAIRHCATVFPRVSASRQRPNKAASQQRVQRDVKAVCKKILARTDLPDTPDHDLVLERVMSSESYKRHLRGEDPFPDGRYSPLPPGKKCFLSEDIRLSAKIYMLYFGNVRGYTVKVSQRFSRVRLSLQRALLCFDRHHGGHVGSFREAHPSFPITKVKCKCSTSPEQNHSPRREPPVPDLVQESMFPGMKTKARSRAHTGQLFNSN